VSLSWLLILVGASIAAYALVFTEQFLGRLLEAGGVSLILLLVYFLAKGKFGLADVVFAFPMGMVLGFWDFQWALAIAAGLAILGFFMIKSTKTEESLPFIPFLYTGSVLFYLGKGIYQSFAAGV
jgi:hypothetical protein